MAASIPTAHSLCREREEWERNEGKERKKKAWRTSGRQITRGEERAPGPPWASTVSPSSIKGIDIVCVCVGACMCVMCVCLLLVDPFLMRTGHKETAIPPQQTRAAGPTPPKVNIYNIQEERITTIAVFMWRSPSLLSRKTRQWRV